jgi:hypothetical protein
MVIAPDSPLLAHFKQQIFSTSKGCSSLIMFNDEGQEIPAGGA